MAPPTCLDLAFFIGGALDGPSSISKSETHHFGEIDFMRQNRPISEKKDSSNIFRSNLLDVIKAIDNRFDSVLKSFDLDCGVRTSRWW
jgi:hypothetical protein